MRFSYASSQVRAAVGPHRQRGLSRFVLGLTVCLPTVWGCGASDDSGGGGAGTGLDTAAGTGGAAADPATELDCESPSEQVSFVDSTMRAQYFWADELPAVDPATIETPEAMLEALRNENDRWSAIFNKPEVTAFYDGLSVGLGLRLVDTYAADGSYRPRISLVYEESPAMAAGLQRGMSILEVNGVTVADIASQGLWGTIMGADELGVQVEMLVRSLDGTEQRVTLAKAELQRTSVSVTTVVSVGDMRVGYVMFEQFINPSQEALATSFNLMKEQGATELVLDLRYNTGGWVDVAGYLASLIVGPEHAGETFLRLAHNQALSSSDTIVAFAEYAESLPFDRVAFLVSHDTASASEALINGLRPYIGTHLVGFNTYGKPVGSNGFEFCDKILQPITFVLNNVNGEGGYYQGIAPDCDMDDDFDHQLGDPLEARFAAAIGWLQGNPCPEGIVPNASGALGLPGVAHPDTRQRLIRGPGVDGYYGLF